MQLAVFFPILLCVSENEIYCFSCSQVYWLGDLNYRITEMEPRIVRDLISHNSLGALLECDQLNRQRNQKNVFDGYREGPITFKPTYKYDPGTDDWDSRSVKFGSSWSFFLCFFQSL